jgi:PAS domain S-box-containing protein
MKDQMKIPFGLSTAILASALLVLLVVGTWFYRVQEQAIRQKVAGDLGAIARLKADQISAWRNDQLKDASTITEDTVLLRSVSRFIDRPTAAKGTDLRNRFRSLARQHDYADILLVDPNGNELLNLAGPGHGHTGYLAALTAALSANRPEWTELHRKGKEATPHTSVVAPIFSGAGRARKPIAALVFVSDATAFLFPLIRFWPVSSKSAETLLIRREGDQVLFLNELRHRPDAALTLSFSLSRTEMPAVMAILGEKGFVRGTDYRGVEVAAFLLPITDSPWFIVAKVDSEEVFADWRFRSVLILGLLLGSTVFIVAVGFVLWRRERRVYYKALYLSEAALLADVERQSTILKAIGDAVIAADTRGCVEMLNPVAEALTGWTEAEAHGRPLKEVFRIINQETREEIEDPVAKVLREGLVVGLGNHAILISRDGMERPIADSGAPIKDDKDRITGVVLVFRDRSAERAVQEKLRESEERFRLTFEQAAVGISHIAIDGRWLWVNKKLCEILGYTRNELMEKTFQEITFPDDLEHSLSYLRQLRSGAIDSYSLQKRYIHKDGSIIWANLSVGLVRKPSGEPYYTIAVAEDITERKRAEEEEDKLRIQLMQAQKLESVGRLAGGVAHDYNNMLSVIIGNAELAMVKISPDDPLHANIKQILNAAQRSADITRKLLAFARKQTINPKVLDLNETVEGMLKMLRQLMGEDIDFSWQPASVIGLVKIDPTQIDQILANLCVNARDAIEGVGKVTIETGHVEFDKAYCDNHQGFKPGEYVMLAVSDNGRGMDKETIALIFEPFFTTKSAAEGTGLGLATVYGIVKQNNGFINVYSEPGHGSTFKIYFPRYPGEAEEAKPESTAQILPGRGELVLLVEDETAIMEIGQQMLENIGYKVLAAGSAQEALRLAKEYASGISLLITDVVMPEMNGRALSEKVKAICPDIKTLFMSGYTANVIAHRGELDTGVNFIQKPFSLKDLAAKVREALDQK